MIVTSDSTGLLYLCASFGNQFTLFRSCFHGGAKPPVKGYLHEQKEHVKRFSCTLCRFASTKQETYLRHMKLNHPERAETDRVVVDLKISWVMSDRQLLERVAQEMEVEPPSKKIHLMKG